MKDFTNTNMDINGGCAYPIRFPVVYSASIHRYICSATIFGLSAILVVLSCMAYFDSSGLDFLGPLKLEVGKGFNRTEEIDFGETGQKKHLKLGVVESFNGTEGIRIGETGQKQHLKVGILKGSNGTEGIGIAETGQEKHLKLGVLEGSNGTEQIGIDEKGQKQHLKLGVMQGSNGTEQIEIGETGQKKHLNLGFVEGSNDAEGIRIGEIEQKKHLNLGIVEGSNGKKGIGIDETGQKKHLKIGVGEGSNGTEGIGIGETDQKEELGECDLSEGMWVWDEGYPLYQSHNCPFLDGGFRCQENGRPDRDYLKWRWQPSDCDLPGFDARKFLERIQNRRIVFVGDSIGRNQWESMVCMLAEAVPNKTRIYEVNGNSIAKHTGYLSFRFEDYNCTVEYYRAPFLVYQGHPPVGSPPEVRMTLQIDAMDYTSNLWVNGDILVFNTGHWWNNEKTINRGCYFQEGKTVHMNMDVETAFQRSMSTWVDWVRRHVDSEKTHVFLRTYSPVHFRDGTWKTGGQCHKETWPDLNSSLTESKSWKNRIMSEAIQQLQDRKTIQSLNITYSAEMRKDGHPSIYHVGKGREPAPLNRQDCSHWCLPGVPDQWNHLLYSYLIVKGYGELGTRVSRR